MSPLQACPHRSSARIKGTEHALWTDLLVYYEYLFSLV